VNNNYTDLPYEARYLIARQKMMDFDRIDDSDIKFMYDTSRLSQTTHPVASFWAHCFVHFMAETVVYIKDPTIVYSGLVWANVHLLKYSDVIPELDRMRALFPGKNF
jgi:hypothetical protein